MKRKKAILRAVGITSLAVGLPLFVNSAYEGFFRWPEHRERLYNEDIPKFEKTESELRKINGLSMAINSEEFDRYVDLAEQFKSFKDLGVEEAKERYYRELNLRFTPIPLLTLLTTIGVYCIAKGFRRREDDT